MQINRISLYTLLRLALTRQPNRCYVLFSRIENDDEKKLLKIYEYDNKNIFHLSDIHLKAICDSFQHFFTSCTLTNRDFLPFSCRFCGFAYYGKLKRAANVRSFNKDRC